MGVMALIFQRALPVGNRLDREFFSKIPLHPRGLPNVNRHGVVNFDGGDPSLPLTSRTKGIIAMIVVALVFILQQDREHGV